MLRAQVASQRRPAARQPGEDPLTNATLRGEDADAAGVETVPDEARRLARAPDTARIEGTDMARRRLARIALQERHQIGPLEAPLAAAADAAAAETPAVGPTAQRR